MTKYNIYPEIEENLATPLFQREGCMNIAHYFENEHGDPPFLL
jgi:hypothetical protein